MAKSAKENVDFVPISQKVKFQNGETEKVIEIELKTDGKENQSDKIFKIVLEKANPNFVKMIKPKAMVTIRKPRPYDEIDEDVMSPLEIILEYKDQNLDLIEARDTVRLENGELRKTGKIIEADLKSKREEIEALKKENEILENSKEILELDGDKLKDKLVALKIEEET